MSQTSGKLRRSVCVRTWANLIPDSNKAAGAAPREVPTGRRTIQQWQEDSIESSGVPTEELEARFDSVWRFTLTDGLKLEIPTKLLSTIEELLKQPTVVIAVKQNKPVKQREPFVPPLFVERPYNIKQMVKDWDQQDKYLKAFVDYAEERMKYLVVLGQ
ncbi:hypothetical protein OPT61_g3121 [Boeremia exigua]|uniref:Uncharacterized protein n=1 Tax=Boeremia exigua TaxID=749465 RepID=A0ACC2IJ88_9PLEO|nr:hypothetical protein OPT61_g3121 [Boeremia exigua]